MAEILKLYKKLGETPLESIERFRESHPEYKEKKMEYLGRLDPMAEGLLLVRVGAGARDEYLELDKTYEFEVLWGFKTDTYDILGIITNFSQGVDISEEKLASITSQVSNLRTQTYPPFSSKVFKKNYLFARGRVPEEMELPERGIRVFDLRHIHTRLVPGGAILEDINRRIALVQGDFRQREILKKWREALSDKLDDKFCISKFSADVSAGTYIRGLAHEMGTRLGTGAIAWSIRRTRVGEYYV